MVLRLTRLLLVATLASLLGATCSAQTPPRLWVMGTQVSFGNTVTITLSSDAIGAPALLALGLSPLPLDAPLLTGKGPLYFGQFLLTLPFGAVPSTKRIDVPVVLPAYDPVLDGVHIVLQGYVAGSLSNPATIPLVQPYYLQSDALDIVSPVPQQGAFFGDRVTVGDLNGDGLVDLVVGAWFETVAGQLAAGRAYVLWGPDFTGFVQLTTPTPAFAAGFGGAILVGDLDRDGIDDLVVTQSAGDPPAGMKGYLYIYYGGPAFLATPSLVVDSAGTGVEYGAFARAAALGDINADGYLDIVASVDHALLGSFTNAGRVDVYFGPGFTERQPVWSAIPGTNHYFGSYVAVADVNGDGVTDLIEGSGRTDVGGEVNIGRVEVFYGPSLLSNTTIECPLPDGFNTRFGDEVNALDLEGDGAWEILTRDDRGHAYVFRSPQLTDYILVTRPTDPTELDPESETFVTSSTIGDVNGDRLPDLLLSDPYLGPATGCGVGSKGGWIYVSVGPFFATFDRVSDFQPKCSVNFGWALRHVTLPGELFGSLIVGISASDDGGIPGSGRVTIFQ